MTTPTIDQAFQKRFLSEVRHAYQDEGSVMRDRVLNVNIMGNETVRFPRLAALGAPGPKAPNGDVPIMDITHSYVEPTLVDRFAALLIDKLDQAQTNISLSTIYAKAVAMTMGREQDDILFAEFANTTTTAVVAGGAGLTFAKVLEARETLNLARVPRKGRVFVISSAQETDFLSMVTTTGNHPITTSSDFLSDAPLVSGEVPLRWMGFEWVLSDRLAEESAGVRQCYAYHKEAIGLAWAATEEQSIDWIPMKHGWLVKSAMLLGPKIIENAGVLPVLCAE